MSEQLRFEDEDIPIALRRAWDRALRQLAQRVNKPTFEAHIRTLRPLTLIEETDRGAPAVLITLGVPSAFTREWVEKRHASLIQTLLEEILDRDVRMRFVLVPKEPPASDTFEGLATTSPKPPRSSLPENGPATSASSETISTGSLRSSSAPATPAQPTPSLARPAATKAPMRPSPSHTSASAHEQPPLDRRYTFDNFVVGQTNRLAHAGARAVAQAPGQVYNPLFLYGPSGLGKTHLMHAIGHEIATSSGVERVAYISGETFTSHYISSLRERRTDEFRQRWRSVDVFLIDDIQFIAGKEHTKEEFFHTFNALYQTGKQIVISSDRSPRDLRMMDERLRSRFECGLIADIAPPDLETRLAILHKKADTDQIRIPDDVLLYMARLVQSNIRTLEGALTKLIAHASLVGSPVTTQLAANILEHYYISAGIGATGAAEANAAWETLSARAANLITPSLVQKVVAKRFGFSPEVLVGKRRDRDVAHARQIAMHLMRELTETSLPGIGQFFGGRDHSTVAHACDRIRSLLPFDDDLRSMVDELVAELRAHDQCSHRSLIES